jgi:prevent-host-death family protein
VSTISLKDPKAGLSSYVDDALKGEFVMITRDGKPVAALVPLQAEIAQRALKCEIAPKIDPKHQSRSNI